MVATISLTGMACLSLLVGSAAWAILTLSGDDCVKVTTTFGDGSSQSAETCS